MIYRRREELNPEIANGVVDEIQKQWSEIENVTIDQIVHLK